ncbi:rhomboid protease ROM8, putative [Plasmodium chabaudi chabaudi]|uniref:Rhomboid-like protease n=1 Tax=Plasmodium chabaudi chabaudi TaxID=31271 RepID=A0A4V0K2Y1_PLACU|nr:rhomboid protease ROM8, putative [Plasmodium chabaudi chabaudi]VTZ66657.1 rhomboid protease ROM8, putative [Plasmodium chabaudi chabaudi]|eukprot:XP_016655644.1 rhomboid protease ROM8, putative [Plasmodium chabaudi chabaudi]
MGIMEKGNSSSNAKTFLESEDKTKKIDGSKEYDDDDNNLKKASFSITSMNDNTNENKKDENQNSGENEINNIKNYNTLPNSNGEIMPSNEENMLLSSNNTIILLKCVNNKSKVRNGSKNSSKSSYKKEKYKRSHTKKEKKFKVNSAGEDLLSDSRDYPSLKVNYKINKKTKKMAFPQMTMNDKNERISSSICTDNARFIKFLKEHGKNSHYKNRKRYNNIRIQQKKNVQKKDDNSKAINNYILDIHDRNMSSANIGSNNIHKSKTSLKYHTHDEQGDQAYLSELQIAENELTVKDKNRLKNYSNTIKEENKIIKQKAKIKAFLSRTRSFIFRKKTLRKRKEKIIIFLNHNDSPSENGKFNDHFYKTIHKDDLENLEEEKIYLDSNKGNTIKKIIYRIFPQFSIFSLILFVTFIQWVVFIILISVKSDFPLTPSNDSLKNFGSNFPYQIFKKAEVYRLFTALFLHSNFNHICANTYVQLTVGFLLEYLYGTYVVFLVYVFTGIYGIILSSPLTYCYSTTESSSSSSGIIGIFFSEIVMMTNFNVDTISISVHLFCFFLLLLFLKFSLNTISINIYSHFFGFIGGFLIGIILKRNQLKYFLKNNLLIQILSLIFLIVSLATAIYISTSVIQNCPYHI